MQCPFIGVFGGCKYLESQLVFIMTNDIYLTILMFYLEFAWMFCVVPCYLELSLVVLCHYLIFIVILIHHVLLFLVTLHCLVLCFSLPSIVQSSTSIHGRVCEPWMVYVNHGGFT